MKSNKSNTIKKNLLENFENGLGVYASCKASNIAPKTFYEWLHKDKEFLKQYEKTIKSRCSVLEDSMFETAIGGNATMQIFLSCNWMPEKYHSIMRVEHSGKDGTPIPILIQGLTLKDYPK